MAKAGGTRRSSCGPRIGGGDYSATRGSSSSSSSSSNQRGAAHDEPPPPPPAPSPLEALLDLELLGASMAPEAVEALEGNQAAVAAGDAFGELGALSLELLALQSPHGAHQHWDDDEPAVGAADDHEKRRSPEHPSPSPPPRGASAFFAREHAGDAELLASPSQHSAPFQPSPRHAADGDEYDLASPVALPDTPKAQGLAAGGSTEDETAVASVSRWESVPDLRYDADDMLFDTGALPPPVRTPARSVAKREHRNPFARTSRSAGGATPARSSAHPPLSANRLALATPHQQQQQPQPQPPPASVPKHKVKHGGIYSLLLKNRGPGDHEPILVDEKRSPEVPELSPDSASSTAPARFTAKKSPPAPNHGSIYRMLRRNRSDSQYPQPQQQW